MALAAALGAPALARAIVRVSSMPFETALIGVGFVVALGFLAAGWFLGRRIDRLAEEARRDPVTKVGNRLHWEECLEQEVANAERAKMPLSILVVDVDNLKKLNDAAGHAIGDVALSLVGEALNDTCRSRDIAARFGGDEFAVLLPRTKASEARVLAERLRSELARRRKKHGAPLDKLLTVSIGICDLDSLDAPLPALLVEAADRALYAAKEAGRNRVEVYRNPNAARTSVIISLDERRAKKKRLSSNSSR